MFLRTQPLKMFQKVCTLIYNAQYTNFRARGLQVKNRTEYPSRKLSKFTKCVQNSLASTVKYQKYVLYQNKQMQIVTRRTCQSIYRGRQWTLLAILVRGYNRVTTLLAVVSEQQLRSSRRAPCYSALVCGEEYTVAYTENLAPCPLLSGHGVLK